MLTSNQRVVLRAELVNDPLGRGYFSLSHDAAATVLNQQDRPVVRKISKKALLRWGVVNDRMSKVRTESESGSSGKKSIAYAALKSLDIPGDFIAVDAEFLGMVDVLVQGNILVAADKTALIAAATETVSRVDELCGEGAIADNQDVYVCRVEMGE